LLLHQFLPWVLGFTLLNSFAELYLLEFSSASIYGVIAIWMTIAVTVITAYLLEYSARESWYRGRLLEMQALHDSLTHLPNRRYFDIQISALLKKSARDKKNVVLMMIDLDFFKNYNDFYGHPMGDECLKQVAGALNQRPRRTQDFMARLGGEEFVAVWFDVKPEHVISLGEQLLEQVRALELPHEKSEFGKVTASAGIRVLVSEHPDTDALILLKEADLALYSA
jgi:diguanylate cyclase (GGDEF)-like protein